MHDRKQLWGLITYRYKRKYSVGQASNCSPIKVLMASKFIIFIWVASPFIAGSRHTAALKASVRDMPQCIQICTSAYNNHLLGEKLQFLCQVYCGGDFWSTNMPCCLHSLWLLAKLSCCSALSAYHCPSPYTPSYFYSIKKEALLILTLRYPIISWSLTPPDAHKFGSMEQFS